MFSIRKVNVISKKYFQRLRSNFEKKTNFISLLLRIDGKMIVAIAGESA